MTLGALTAGAEVEVVVDVPRGGFVKRGDDGEVDFVSPVPCPFNYGSVPGTRSADGDRLDALVLGPRVARGKTVHRRVVGVVRFVDAGLDDPKLVCASVPLTSADWERIDRFFRVYAAAKAVLNRLRGKRGRTALDGVERGMEVGTSGGVG